MFRTNSGQQRFRGSQYKYADVSASVFVLNSMSRQSSVCEWSAGVTGFFSMADGANGLDHTEDHLILMRYSVARTGCLASTSRRRIPIGRPDDFPYKVESNYPTKIAASCFIFSDTAISTRIPRSTPVQSYSSKSDQRSAHGQADMSRFYLLIAPTVPRYRIFSPLAPSTSRICSPISFRSSIPSSRWDTLKCDSQRICVDFEDSS